MPLRFVIIGGGPAGVAAATYAARLGAEVTVIERDVLGGAANLWDCIPSKAMIATGATFNQVDEAGSMGVDVADASVHLDSVRQRIEAITTSLAKSNRTLLESQHVNLVEGTGRLVDPHTVVASLADGTEVTIEADAVLVSTGSRPRIPEWAEPDGERLLTTRDAYPPPELPEHLVVIGSGVTGVEFVHMFSSLGSRVTLIVSRQQVLPQKDPEVAAVLEEDFLARGVHLLKGARAVGVDRNDDASLTVRCDDGRVVTGSHALLAIGSIPNTEGVGLVEAGVAMDGLWPKQLDHHLRTNVPTVYLAGDVSGKLPLASVASMQGKKIAEHVMGLHIVVAPPPGLRQGRFGHLHPARDRRRGTGPRADAFAEGRKVRVTKVPFATTAKALINNDARGFVKIISDPATGVVLGRFDRGPARRRADLGARRRRYRRAAGVGSGRQPAGAPGPRRGVGRGGRVDRPGSAVPGQVSWGPRVSWWRSA
jgi:pyruvate/2-oxoglutarate dehydrogenase complex dihydrolipoamide dehydrogenase (E3) component